MEKKPDVEIRFAGRPGSMEQTLTARHDIDMIMISAVRMRRSLIGIIRFAFGYPITVLRAFFMLRSVRPRAVCATGGFVAGPLGAAAFLRGIPVVLQEQNALPGLSSKLLNLFARTTFTAYPQARDHFMRKKSVENVGNPVRKFIAALSREQGCEILGCDPGDANILILGGSQGARSINASIESFLDEFIRNHRSVNLIWQCGGDEEERLQKICREKGVKAVIRPFFDRMDAVYASADLAVCRGGALTLAELSVAGIPMIIVPYPFATGNHQFHNAMYYQKNGAAIIVGDDSELESNLRQALIKVLDSPELRDRLAQASKRTGRPEAADLIADRIIELIGQVTDGIEI